MDSPWLLASLFAACLVALGLLVRAMMRTLRQSRLCDLPLRDQQDVEFPIEGRVVLCMQGPRFTPRFRRLRYELRLPGGAEVPGRPVLFRLVTSGLSQARVTLRTFALPFAGRYQLSVHGLEPDDVDSPRHRIVFMRPHLLHSVLLIVGTTLVAALAVASLVSFLLAVVPTAAAIDPGQATGHLEIDGERRTGRSRGPGAEALGDPGGRPGRVPGGRRPEVLDTVQRPGVQRVSAIIRGRPDAA